MSDKHEKRICISFAIKKLNFWDETVREDLKNAIKSASRNLLTRYNIELSHDFYTTEDGNTVVLKVAVPNDISFSFNRLRGISMYLLKHGSVDYSKCMLGNRLLTYHEEIGEIVELDDQTTTQMKHSICTLEFDKNRLPRIAPKAPTNRIFINAPNLVVEMLNDIFHAENLPEEHGWLICLNSKCELINVFEISHGSCDGAMFGPREIFMRALLSGARSIVVAHNHPSGNVTMSNTDHEALNTLKEAAEIMGIELSDFIVIGENGTYYSFSDQTKEEKE